MYDLILKISTRIYRYTYSILLQYSITLSIMTISYQIGNRKIIIAILAIVVFIFAIKLYQTYLFQTYNNHIETFESNLLKLKSQHKNNERFDNVSKKHNGVKIKRKITFDDLIKETEDIDPSKYTITNLKKSFFGYVNSFNKEKFKNTTGTTTEALEKFDYFKEKFFEIFK